MIDAAGPGVSGETMRLVHEDSTVMAIAGLKALLAHIHIQTPRNIGQRAEHGIRAAHHRMALEDQTVDQADEREQMKQLVKQITEKAGSRIWEGE